MNQFEILFNKLNFKNKKIRDKILVQFNQIIENFKKQNKISSNTLAEIYGQYVSKTKKSITINNFTFQNDSSGILLFNSKTPNICITFQIIKPVSIVDAKKIVSKEWIISVEYLQYLLDNIYQFKHPKFAHSIDSMNSDDSVLSINDNNIFELLIMNGM